MIQFYALPKKPTFQILKKWNFLDFFDFAKTLCDDWFFAQLLSKKTRDYSILHAVLNYSTTHSIMYCNMILRHNHFCSKKFSINCSAAAICRPPPPFFAYLKYCWMTVLKKRCRLLFSAQQLPFFDQGWQRIKAKYLLCGLFKHRLAQCLLSISLLRPDL